MAQEKEKRRRFRLLPRLSSEAIFFIILFLAITFAGFNSGNNLLYLIAGLMFAGIIVSSIAGRINLSQVHVCRHFPTYIFAGEPFSIRLEIGNAKRMFYSFGIKLDGIGEKGDFPALLSIRRKSKETREAQAVLPRRGQYQIPPLMVKSGFPFGLFESKRMVAGSQEVIVYPPIYDVSGKFGGSSHLQDEFPRHLKGPGSGMYGVREYRHGEDAVSISWKLSAKLDRLIVRETEQEGKKRVCVVFDNILPTGSEAALEAFERAVSTVASLVWYLNGNSYSVRLITRDKIIGYGEGSDHLHRMLIALALIEAAPADAKVLSVGKNLLEGGVGVLVRCGGGSTSETPTDRDFAMVLNERVAVERI